MTIHCFSTEYPGNTVCAREVHEVVEDGSRVLSKDYVELVDCYPCLCGLIDDCDPPNRSYPYGSGMKGSTI